MTEEQIQRYKRHIILDGVGTEGQERLLAASVLIVGAGGLGSPISLYLAAAGIGRIGIADADKVDISNLQRQVIHTTNDIGRQKALSAKEKILAINPDIIVDIHDMFIEENADEMVKNYNFIVDATDNYAAKFLINDVCIRQGKPFSHGSLLRLGGQVFTHIPGSACYRCLFGNEPEGDSMPNSSDAGILGAVAGIVGTIQATEVLKYFTKCGTLLTNRLLCIDAQTMTFNSIAFGKDNHCHVCTTEK